MYGQFCVLLMSIAVISSFVLLFISAPAAASDKTQTDSSSSQCCPHGKRSERNLIDQDGTIVQLRGMSLFWSQFETGAKFFNEQTVNCLKCSWHANIVRASLGVDQGGYLQNPDQEYAKVQTVVNAAINNCLYVLIDWHYSDSAEYKDQAVHFFSKITQLCAGKCNCLYETWNEAKDRDWSSQLKPYHETVIKAIRENDKDGVVVVGTPNYDQEEQVAANDPITDQINVMYSLHFYAASHKQELRDKAQQAIDKGLPLFVTEYGTTSYTGDGAPNLGEASKWYDFLNKNSISYINWAIDDKQEASASLQHDSEPADVCNDARLTESGKFVKDDLLSRNSKKPNGC